MKKLNNISTKKAFSMITAIFVILIMATVTALIMNVTGKTIKETTHQYQKEQAALLARSYTEQAMLYALHYDRASNGDCINTINATFGDNNTTQQYTIRTELSYIGNTAQLPAGCNRVTNGTWTDDGTGGFNSTVSLIIDVYITYKDFDDITATRDVTYHRRTLQKL